MEFFLAEFFLIAQRFAWFFGANALELLKKKNCGISLLVFHAHL
jgi:hypothetical protein